MYIGLNRNPITVIILSIVTCGIYLFYWLYQTMEDMNKSLGEQRINSTLFLILSIVCAPVIWYVMYQIDKGFVDICGRENVPYKENFILWLLLSFVGVGSIVFLYQAQSTFNMVWDARSSKGGAPVAE